MTTPTIVQEDQIAVVVCHLNIWRKAIQSYKNEHGAWPGWNNPDAFIGQISGNTNANGAVGDGADFPFGPYINGEEMPINPITETTDVMIVDAWPTEATGNCAWIYNWNNGEIRINNNGITSDGEKIFNF